MEKVMSRSKTAVPGRPAGTSNPTEVERMRRAVPNIYAAVRQRALSGDAEAARLCFDIVMDKDGKRFPHETH